MPHIVLRQVPNMVADAIGAELAKRDLSIIEESSLPDGEPYVDLVGIFGDSLEGWSHLTTATEARIGVVVITDHHHLSVYRRAYAAGASVAHVDSPLAAAADVITARCRGEIIAPARLLEACLTDNASVLSVGERLVLGHFSDGLTIARVAEITFYSERHVRRLLQSILAKAGTSDRREAVVHFRSELRAG